MVQHGEAESKEQNAERPLSKKGIENAGKLARFLAKAEIQPGRIFCSEKLRAKQTAERLAEKLNPENKVEEIKGIAPLDDPRFAFERVNTAVQPLMLVGHLPHLSKLASLLITGNFEKEVVAFKYSGCVCIEKAQEGWRVKWAVRPEFL